MTGPAVTYLVRAAAVLQDSVFNQRVLKYVSNPKERYLKGVTDYLLSQSSRGPLGTFGAFGTDEYRQVQEALDRLVTKDSDEWRKLLTAIRQMSDDFKALAALSPFTDEELRAIAQI